MIHEPIPMNYPPLPVGPEEVPTLLKDLFESLEKYRTWRRIGFRNIESFFA